MQGNFFNLSDVNLNSKNQIPYIEKNENLYDEKIENTVNSVMSKNEKLIMLTGPSSSGKTTTAKKIEKLFEEKGIPCETISLDSFFKNKSEIMLDEFGKHEFERPDALELSLITEKLNELQKNGKAKLPIFSFLEGKRFDDAVDVDLQGGVAIVEGIHALNPIILNDLCTSDVFKLYISVHSNFEINGKVVLTKRLVRFIRRLVRDYKFRNSDAENTYSLWEKVVKDEVEFVIPYSKYANIRIDTTFPFEVGLFKDEAIKILSELSENSIYRNNANKLIENLSIFEVFDKELLPNTSLLTEFCGGGIFEY